MFGHRFFGIRFFAGTYFGDGGSLTPVIPNPWTPVTPDSQAWVSASGDTQVWTPATLDSQSWIEQ